MDMWIWKELGISPTTDISQIKSAYARAAKIYHPEEHPEEFKKLQYAYKSALHMARGAASYAAPTDISRENADSEILTGEKSEEKTEEKEASENSAFDYSGVDSYGERELFFSQFLLMAQNPYLCNNLEAWDYFLNRKEFAELFASTDFRMDFVHTMCSQCGWRRKTVVFFERYLNKFHTEENKPADGKWETQLDCFRIKKRPYPGLPDFCTRHFMGKEGAAFHKQLRLQISRAQGRELSLDIKSDLIKYMKLYLFLGASKGNDIERFHKDWIIRKNVLNGAVFAGCFIALLAWVFSMKWGKENDNHIGYLMELYGLEAEDYSDEEKEELLENYNTDWGYAKEALDEVLNRYEGW